MNTLNIKLKLKFESVININFQIKIWLYTIQILIRKFSDALFVVISKFNHILKTNSLIYLI